MPSSSKSKLSAVLSKRRPRQNIIAMILKGAKGSGGSTGSGGKSNSSKGGSGSTTGGEKSSSRMKSFSSSSSRTKRNIIQSAVDLTGKLSKRTTRKRHGRSGGKGGRSGQSGSIVKGQKGDAMLEGIQERMRQALRSACARLELDVEDATRAIG